MALPLQVSMVGLFSISTLPYTQSHATPPKSELTTNINVPCSQIPLSGNVYRNHSLLEGKLPHSVGSVDFYDASTRTFEADYFTAMRNAGHKSLGDHQEG